MLQLDDCKNKLAKFKQHSGLKYGLIRIGIFGSVARKENTDNSDIDMRLQAIGEQIGKILKEDNCPFDKYPEIPWVAAYDMRNFISHEYANIDEAIVFDVIKEELPRMQEAVKKMLLEY